MAVIVGPHLSLESETLHDLHPSSFALVHAKPEIIFNVLPPSVGKSFLVLLIAMSFCLGANVMEFFNHIRFDIQLIRKPGWTDPAKAASRVAYLICRYISIIGLTLIILFLSLKLDHCKPLPWTFNLMSMTLYDAVSLIFVQRTMALYSWKRKVVVPLSTLYVLAIASAAVCMPFYGEGYRIPGTRFCAYDTHRGKVRTLVANIVFKSLSMTLDIVLLLLTLHRLLEGGLPAIWHKKRDELFSHINDRSLSGFLLRQGFHFYLLQFSTDVFFVSTYFSFSDISYQCLATALIFTIPPIAAASAFRNMGKKALQVNNKQNYKVHEIINSTNTPSGDNSAVRGPAGIRLSGIPRPLSTVVAAPPTELEAGNHWCAVPTLDSAQTHCATLPDKTKRYSWGARRHKFSNTHQEALDFEKGITVTVGTIEHTEPVEPDWNLGSPTYSSDHVDPEAAQWPKLATTGSVPMLTRRPPTGHEQLGEKAESSNEHWIPQTPDTAYPDPLLAPKDFSRHPSESSSSSSSSSRPRKDTI